MGFSVRIFFINDQDEIKRISYASFEKFYLETRNRLTLNIKIPVFAIQRLFLK